MANAEDKLRSYVDAVQKELETRIQRALNGMLLMERRRSWPSGATCGSRR